MRKGTDIIGKNVIAMDTGEKLDTISDLIFDQNTNQLLGFVVDEGGWFSEAKVLPLQNVQTIGPDAILIANRGGVVESTRVPAIQQILQRNNILKGTKVMTTDGRDLGTLADLYFDEHTGRIEGYDVSGGVFADAYSGRSFVPATHTFNIGTDAAFVPPEVATMMEVQEDGGIKGALQTAGGKVKDAAQTAGDKVKDVAGDARAAVTNRVVDPAEQREFVLGKMVEADVTAPDGTLIIAKGQQVTPLSVDAAQTHGVLDTLYRATGGSVGDQLKAKASDAAGDAAAAATVEQTRGRRVMEQVRTAEGIFVAAPGQIVTDTVIERAKHYNREQELMEATGLTPRDAARGSANAAGDKISQGAATVKEGASTVWDKIKGKVDETQTQAAQKLEEQRIEHALGRPTTRVILDRQDNVILNTGEIITHKAVDMARQADVLGVLLSSVFDHEPPLAPEASRAPEPGMAALDNEQASGA